MKIPKIPLWTSVLVLCGGVTLQAEDTPVQAAARTAMMQKMHELDANPPVTAPTAPAMAVTPSGATTVAPAPGKVSKTTVNMTPMNSQPARTAAQKPATPPAPAVANIPAGDAGFKPMPVPPSSLPLTKEEKLNWLLQRYKADQITPEEYHQQRAALLAKP